VFPFVPASPQTNGVAPAASPLSSILLSWSSVQRRLKARDPGHTGAVIPVVIDDAGEVFFSAHAFTTAPLSPPKRGGRFSDAADTVRAYCRENGLVLVSIVSAAPSTIRTPVRSPDIPHTLISPIHSGPSIPGLNHSALTRTDEEALIELYRTHILDPLSVVRALGDLLANPQGNGGMKGRVLFVETSGTIDDLDPTLSTHSGAAQMISAARAEAARVLREELGGAGIGVCEIVVGEFSVGKMTPADKVSSRPKLTLQDLWLPASLDPSTFARLAAIATLIGAWRRTVTVAKRPRLPRLPIPSLLRGSAFWLASLQSMTHSSIHASVAPLRTATHEHAITLALRRSLLPSPTPRPASALSASWAAGF